MLYRLVFIVGVFFLSNLNATQAPATIYASGNNKFVLHTFLKSFSKKYPEADVVVQYGASGDLANAILKGASYDVFLSASMDYAQKIYDANRSADIPKEYARGSLILFIPADATLHQKKLEILKSKKIRNISIANKKTAPYGMASIEVLQNLNLLPEVEKKIRYTKDIANAIVNVIWYDDAGFVSKSVIKSLPHGYDKKEVSWIEIDEKLYSPIIQGYVVSKKGLKNKNAQKFLDYLHSNEGQAIYKEFGYK